MVVEVLELVGECFRVWTQRWLDIQIELYAAVPALHYDFRAPCLSCDPVAHKCLRYCPGGEGVPRAEVIDIYYILDVL